MQFMEYDVKACGYDWVEVNDAIWMPLADRNGICKLDNATAETSIIALFSDYDVDAENLYYIILKWNKELIFVPGYADDIVVYDTKSHKIENINLELPNNIYEADYSNSIFFLGGFVYGTAAYLFGSRYPAIVKIDMESKRLTYITDWLKIAKERVETGFFAEGFAKVNSYLYLAIRKTNLVVGLDLSKDKTETIPVGTYEKKYMYTISYLEKVCLIGWNNKKIEVILWDTIDNTTSEYDIEFDYVMPQSGYWTPTILENWLYFFPYYYLDMVYKINLLNGEYMRCPELEEEITIQEGKRAQYSVLAAKSKNGTLVFQTAGDNIWHKYNPKSGIISRQKYIINDQAYIQKYWKKKYGDDYYKRLHYETDMSLEAFLAVLLRQ